DAYRPAAYVGPCSGSSLSPRRLGRRSSAPSRYAEEALPARIFAPPRRRITRFPAGSKPNATRRTYMNWSTIETGWTSYKANAKQRWSRLSDEQIDGTMGKREQLTSRVQQAYAVSQEEAARQISDWQSKQKE